jgi:uncharacterized protein (TIGR02246 family)
MIEQETEVRALLDEWVKRVGERDAAAVAELYHPTSQFWGTLASHVRDEPVEVRDYFDRFLDRHSIAASIGNLRLRPHGDLMLAAGHYIFTWQDKPDADEIKARTRFTFVFGKIDGDWTILQHHSSAWVLNGF